MSDPRDTLGYWRRAVRCPNFERQRRTWHELVIRARARGEELYWNEEWSRFKTYPHATDPREARRGL